MDKAANLFPAVIANYIEQAGCHASVAEKVFSALCGIPESDCIILWLRIQGRTYGEISRTLGINKGTVFHVVNGRIKRTVYSIIEHSTAIPATQMVS